MFTIALIGPDGAGKTTIGRRLEHALPLPVKYVYMGVNFEASNIMLPTTRLVMWSRRIRGKQVNMGGPPDLSKAKPKPKGLIKRVLAAAKSSLRLVNQLCEEWYRQLVVWSYQRRNFIVLFDRHFFIDYYASDISGTNPHATIFNRIHGWFLKHLYPRPDLVIMLDAPAEVLYARKQEGSVELLERRRQDYLRIRNEVPRFAVVDVTRSEDEVAREVTELIWSYYESKTGNRVAARNSRS